MEERAKTTIFAALVAVTALVWVACGGGQTSDTGPAEVPPPAETAQPAPEPEPPPPVVEPEDEHVYYRVYWHDIQVLTIYRGGGPLRSEEPGSSDAYLEGSSPYMSAISHYIEQEREIAELIDRAESLDEFLQILAEEGYELEEDYLEAGY